MSHRYTVIFEKEAEGGYHVFCPTLPGVSYAERDCRRRCREHS
jgi:hypothetical protein